MNPSTAGGVTYSTVYAKRGKQAMEAVGILANLKNCSIHNGWRPNSRVNGRIEPCNVHHLRMWNFLEEHYPQEWFKSMKDLLKKIKKTVKKGK